MCEINFNKKKLQRFLEHTFKLYFESTLPSITLILCKYKCIIIYVTYIIETYNKWIYEKS